MREGPSKPDYRVRLQAAPKLLRSRAWVVNVGGNVAARLRKARIGKTNTSEPLMTCRKRIDDAKTGFLVTDLGKVQGEPVYCLGGIRHGGGVNLIQALMRNVRTCRLDEKGKIQMESMRVKVLMQGTGAEQLVVAEKSVKTDGAKGLRYSVLFGGQPDKGRSR